MRMWSESSETRNTLIARGNWELSEDWGRVECALPSEDAPLPPVLAGHARDSSPVRVLFPRALGSVWTSLH